MVAPVKSAAATEALGSDRRLTPRQSACHVEVLSICRDVEHQRIPVCTARALMRSTAMDLPGIEFVGFSNPKVWDLERLLGSDPEVLAKAKALPQREQWRLAEILDPDTFTHYEFFLKKGKVTKKDWSAASEADMHQAFAIRQAGLQPWPSDRVFDESFNQIHLTEAEYELLQKCAQDPTVELTEWGDEEEPRQLKDIIAEMDKKPTKEEILRLLKLEFLFLRSP